MQQLTITRLANVPLPAVAPGGAPQRKRSKLPWLAGLGGLMLCALPVVLLAGAGNPPCVTAATPGTVNKPAGGGPVAAGMYAQSLRLQPARWYRVGATMYGGPTDPTSGDYGSIGTPGQSYLPAHPDSFAELSVLDHNPANGSGSFAFQDANALNSLPYLTGLRVANNGVQKILYKRDVGYGQGPGQLIANGQPYRLDVWWQSAGPLGVSKNPVDIELAPPTGSGATLEQLPSNTQAPGASTIDPGCAAAISGSGIPLPLVPGTQTKILPSGVAAAGQSAPAAVKAMVAAGNRVREAVRLRRRSLLLARHAAARLRLLERRLLRPARRWCARPERARLRRARELGAAGSRAVRDRLRQRGACVHVRRRAEVRHLLQRHRHRTERRPGRSALAGLPHRPLMGDVERPAPTRAVKERLI